MISHPQEEATCTNCEESVEEDIVSEYFKMKAEVIEALGKDEIPPGAATEYLSQMIDLFPPYDLTFISVCQLALTDCLVQNKLKQGLEIAHTLFEVCRRLARGTHAQVGLVLRMMKIQAELGLKKEIDI